MLNNLRSVLLPIALSSTLLFLAVLPMSPLKIVGYCLGGLVLLLVLALLGIWLMVNPNDYKGRIVSKVREVTGRELVLPGDIKLSVFPWIALKLGQAQLGNPAGFTTQPFVSFQSASVRIKLLPLLSKRLEVGEIAVDGLDLRLLRNADGKGNWEGFGGQKEAVPKKDASTSGTFGGLAGIKIRDSRVSYQNIVLEKFNFETGAIAEKSVVPITFSFDCNRGEAAARVSVAAKMSLDIDSAAQQYKLSQLAMSGHWLQPPAATDPKLGVAGPKPATADLPWDLTVPALALDLNAQSLAVPSFALGFAGAQVSGAMQGTKLIDALSMVGSFKLTPLDLRAFLGKMGVTKTTKDPAVLAKLLASGDFAYGGQSAQLENLHLSLDQTEVQGKVAVTNLATNAIRFELGVDKIDVDRYLEPEKKKPDPVQKPFELPTATMKGIDANGTLTVGSARLSNMDFTNIKLTVNSKDGVVRLFPSQAQFLGGHYSGDVTLDSRGNMPAIKVDQQLTGIDMRSLLMATMKSERLSGHGNLSIRANARGGTMDALVGTMNGRIEANLNDGAIEGLDLWFELGRAQALIKRQDLPAGSSSNRTKFDAFKASADITNGVATTKDLMIASQGLKVTGQGNANLRSQAIDYQVLASIAQGAGKSAVEIPVRISGLMAKPQVRPDLEALAKGQLKQKVQEKVKDLLQDQLKGLFGKP